MADAIRIGALGAAAITPGALLRPARKLDGVVVEAVAARDRARAEAFAGKHGIPRAYGDYEALIDDPEIDAIYVALPNGLHAEWSIRALEAGKHVLCEKPVASNADEARQIRAAALASGRLAAEAFHWRYHPLADRVREILQSGEIGTLRRVEASFCFPLLPAGDIRWRLDLAGGALMDAGCYAVNIVRFLAGAEPEVVSARAKTRDPDVDRLMEIELRFPDGTEGFVRASMLSRHLLAMHANAEGSDGAIRITNPILPHLFHRLRVRSPSGRRREQVPGDATYLGQLRAFRDWIRDGTPRPTDLDDGIANMEVIDAAYRAAGLPLRSAP